MSVEADSRRYLAVELAGGSTAIARKYAKASLDLANELQHERTAAFRKAASAPKLPPQ